MQNTFSQSGNDSKWFLIKIIFQNRYVALETGLDPPPLHGKCPLKFPFWFSAPFPNVISDTCISHLKWTESPRSLWNFFLKKCGLIWQKFSRVKIYNLKKIKSIHFLSNGHPFAAQSLPGKVGVRSIIWESFVNALYLAQNFISGYRKHDGWLNTLKALFGHTGCFFNWCPPKNHKFFFR